MKQSNQRLATQIAKDVELDYLLYLPEETPATPPPLLLFLHGAGERGSDVAKVKENGLPARLENGLELPFVVVAPQCPADSWWETDSLTALLDTVLDQHDIDHSRIYLTGLSMGGSGSWALANACPGRFAAIAPICGPRAFINPANFKDTPTWCFHGAMDDIVPISDSVMMVKWLREGGADVRFTVYPDAAHDSWTPTYDGNELYDWLLTHRSQA
jgi:predicted peptidase